MKNGAFAMIDCLGFKRIWKRTKPDVVIRKLLRLETSVKSQIISKMRDIRFMSDPIISIRFLSDTVVVSVQNKDIVTKNKKDNAAELVGVCCLAIPLLLDMFLKDEPNLTLRGCITFGSHICDGNFIVGPAVDEAAEHMNAADGAFVWLLPEAAALNERFQANIIRYGKSIFKLKKDIGIRTALEKVLAFPDVLAGYDMPLKSGRSLTVSLINPIHGGSDTFEHVTSLYSKAMASRQLDVMVKHQNTLKFLSFALAQTVRAEEELIEARSAVRTSA